MMATMAGSADFPFPVRDVVAVGDRDVSAYAVMLARQLADNVAIDGRRSQALRWLFSPLSDHLARPAATQKMTGLAGSLLFLTGSRNHTVLDGFAIEPSVDTIRLAARSLGLREVGLSYARPEIDGQFICDSTAMDDAIGTIRRHAARGARYTPGVAYDRFVSATANEAGLPRSVVRVWMNRQFRLLSAARSWFGALFRGNSPEALFCHGGVNFLTAGAKLAAGDIGFPALEIQHGAINMLDPHRVSSPLISFADELLLAWLPHGETAGEAVVGPPVYRLHEWLDAGAAIAVDHLPAAFRDAYGRAAGEARDAAGRAAGPIVLAALQQSVDEEKLFRAAIGTQATVWVRGHPNPRRAGATAGFDATLLPLGVLLDHTDWVVTGHSSVAVEATAFGCGVRFLSSDGPLLFPGIQSDDAALAAFPAPDIARSRWTCALDTGWMAALRKAGWRLPAKRRGT